MVLKKTIRICLALTVLLPVVCLAQDQHRDDDHGYGEHHDHWQNRLSPEDQSRYDSYYSRWLEYRQANNREQIASMEERMRDVMVHNSIPPDTDFARIASPSVRRGSRREIPPLSASDAKRFRSYYSRWQNYRQANDNGQVQSMERRMRDVMSRNNIPGDVSYDEVMEMLNRSNR